jgi:6-phosphogluconolactonase
VRTRTRRATAGGGEFCLGLSGGSTPRRLYELLGSPPLLDELPWSRTQVFWCDERAVPPDSPDSNYALAAATLLRAEPVPAERLHRMEAGADDLEAARARYEETFRAIACRADRAPHGLDVALLGMGADGHTASLFPHSAALGERERLVAITEGGSPPVKRLTLTLPALNRSREAIFLVAGAAKADAVARALAGDADPRDLPAVGVSPTGGPVVWLLDREAAAGLPDRLPGGVGVM